MQGLDALETGVRMLPASAGLFVAALAGSGLAKRYGVSVGELRRANGMSERETLKAGESLKIPG